MCIAITIEKNVAKKDVTCIKSMTNQQMNFIFMVYFYLWYFHQHISASNLAIFRVMVLVQEYSCS